MLELTNELLVGLLFFFLVFFVTFQICMRLFNQRATSAIIGLAVSALSWFYLTRFQTEFLFNTYGLAGTILILLIPSLVLFFFIYSTSLGSATRRILWIAYGALVFIMLNNNKNLPKEQETPILLAALIILAILLLFDKQIRNQFNIRKNLKK